MGMITYDDGTQEWREDGRLHRLDGPARIWSDGGQEWYVNGARHRLGAPAVIHDSGYQAWYVNGQKHRLDGPAVSWGDGSQGWYVNHKHMTQEVTAWMYQRNITWPWDHEAQMEFLLTWA